MGTKPFQRHYKLIEGDKLVYLNADHIARIDVLGRKPDRQMIFYLSNGLTYTLTGAAAEKALEFFEKDAATSIQKAE